MAESQTKEVDAGVVERLVRADDGHEFRLRVSLGTEARATLVFMPAMGVRASFYDDFADALAARGLRVGVADLRGLGSSSIRAGRGVDFGYHEILTQDFPAIADAIDPVGPLYFGGHSLGGQLATLYAASSDAVEGVAIVATCLPYFRGWHGLAALRVRTIASAFRAIGRVVGHFPGDRIGFGGREARTLMSDWASSAIAGQYRIHNSADDWETTLARLSTRLLAIEIEGDDWAPADAISALVDKCERADVVRRVEPGSDRGHPHFAWVKSPDAVVDAIDRFIT